MPQISKGSASNQSATTPEEVFAPIRKFWQPAIDLAASFTNTKCEAFIDEAQDSLIQPWHKLTSLDFPGWCNHPYEDCTIWIKKGHDEARLGATAIQLQPLATHRAYYRNYCKRGPCAVVPINRPVKFGGYGVASPLPHAFYFWNRGLKGGIYGEVDYLDEADCQEVFDKIRAEMQP